MKPIAVTSYVNPDLDGLASAVAYAEYLQKNGKDVVVGILGEPHIEARYVLDRFSFSYPPKLQNVDDFEQVVLVDASDLTGLEGRVSPDKVCEIIDHRKVNEAGKFHNAKVQIELVGAAATLVAEKFMLNQIDISQASATLLYAAIVSNTSNFKSSVTTNRDKDAALWLNKVAGLAENFWKDLFRAKSDLSDHRLFERIYGDFSWFTFGGKKVGIAQIEIIGVKPLLVERLQEIFKILKEIKQEMKLDYVFLTAVELDGVKNFFVTEEIEMQKLLEEVLHINFSGAVAERDGIIMRKQIGPLLKEKLEIS